MGPELFQKAGEVVAGFVARASTRFTKMLLACPLMALAAIPMTLNSAKAAEDLRVALVIGNGAYMNAPRLDNPVSDAKAVAGAFRTLGFRVVDGYDLDIAQMRAKISEFSADLPGAKSAVIYYAGHGISVDDENYLIPTDIVLKSPTDLDLGAISVSLLLKQMKREDRVNVVILDACRDNPFAAELAKHTRALVGERGLSRIDGDLARGTLIAFASDPRSTALDGAAGQHSPFTNAFLDHVYDSGVSIDTVMSRVRTEVWEKTRHIQLPWVNTSLIGDYALNPQLNAGGAKTPAPSGADTSQNQEDLLWESAQHSNLSADYQAYLDAFPNGIFAQMAKNRIASRQTAAPQPSAQAPQNVASTEPGAHSGKAEIGAGETVIAPPPPKDWRAEIGTAETERALNLTVADQNEIQERLMALGLYGATRTAIADWQKSRGVAPTSFLGSMQLAELRVESEGAYQKYLAAKSAPREAPKQAIKPALSKASPKPAGGETTHKAKAPGRIRTATPANPATPPPAADMLPGKTWINRRYDAWQWVDH